VIVGSSVFTVGTILSESLKKPYVFIAFCPQMLPSSEHPSPMVKWQTLPRALNRHSWTVNEWAWGLLLQKTLNAARSTLGLPPVTRTWESLIGSHPIVACDPALAVAPTDYPLAVTQVGAMFAQQTEALSPELESFLQAGPPPVYIGFGSMSDPNPQKTTERIIEAAKRAEVRAVISKGWARLGAEAVPRDVLLIGPEPHTKLFPRCAAVVHHGGAGTTHAAARAGVPQVLMPQLLDQFYWADRVQRVGIGPTKVPRHDDDPELLAQALRECVGSTEVRDRARAIAESLVQNGAERLATALEQLNA
jgi:UDP:flavonoid glycosyltransferase YjiC (YdhE family)